RFWAPGPWILGSRRWSSLRTRNRSLSNSDASTRSRARHLRRRRSTGERGQENETMTLNVGVNVVEVDGRTAPTIQPAPTSVGAFVGVAERGVPNRAVRVNSPDDVRASFGSPRADAYMTLALDGFFLNGGATAYVVRVVGAGSLAAGVTL